MESAVTICLFIALSLLAPSDCLKSKGTSFVLTFLDNEVEYWQDLPLEVWVINDGPNTATATISAPRDNNLLRTECTGAKTANIAPGQQHKFSVCWWAKIMGTDNSVNDKAIRIDSTSEVSVMAVNKEAFSADAFHILPISSLGTAYYSVVAGPGEKKPNTFAVIATADDTTVTITLPVNENSEGPPVSFNYRCLVHESGSTFTIRLFAHQVFYIMTFADITGTKIMSSNPIAVFNGNTRASEPAGERTRDHICEQAVSSGNWDTEYVYTPIYGSSVPGDNVRVLSDEPNNRISYVDISGASNSFVLQIGEWREIHLTNYTYMSSNKKFSAVACTLSQSGADGLMRDPTLVNLQGFGQWTNLYTFPAVISAQSTLNGEPAQPYKLSYFVVTVKDGDKDGLRLDGSSITFDECTSLPGGIGMQSCIKIVNGSNDHQLTHSTGNVFGTYVFATDNKETISTTLGMNAPSQCEKVVMRRGDAIDNDCDGEVDEEICDGIDNDGDSIIDEDCESGSGQARGRTYVIVFPDNSKSDGNADDLDKLELYISPQNTEGATIVNVSAPLSAITFEISTIAQTNMTTKIEIPKSFRLPPSSGKFDRALLIETDFDVVVYALNKIKFSSDAYLAIPVDATGYDYYAATINVTDSNDVAEIAMVAADVGTTSIEIHLANIEGVQVSYLGQSYGPGETILTDLEQYGCLQIQSPADLTGTRILSTNQKRLSVFSGNRRPVIGGGNARDHIVEQINPVPTWGREFFTNPIKRDGTQGDQRGDIFRVIVSEPNTDVTVSSGSSAGSYQITEKGGYLELELASTEYTMISTSSPALVVQYSKTQTNNNADIDKGDPSMALVIPKESWTNDYRFVTPRSGQLVEGTTDEYQPYTSRMSIIIETQFISKLRYGNVDTLFEDIFSPVTWNAIAGSQPEVSATTVDIQFGQNYVTAVDDVVFAAMVYGAADREFYSAPISLKLATGMCEPSSPSVGDGLDNDCDGSVDEELCNDFDDDNDGEIDEDCSMPPDGSNGRYIFSFMENVVEYPLINPLIVLATSTCPQMASVRLRTPGAPSFAACDINVQIPSGGMTRFALPNWFRQSGSERYNRTLLIETSCGIDIAAYNMDKFSNDAFKVHATTMLGTEYRTISFWPTTLGSVLSAVASEDTTVSVTLPVHTNVPGSTPSVQHPVTNVTLSNGQSFTVPLAQYESFQLISSGDLSGTIITSGADVAVFSGNIRVGIESRSRDHIVEQLTPWTQASNEWIVATNEMTNQEIVKFTCDASTSITFPAFSGVAESTFSFIGNGNAEEIWLPRSYTGRVTATGGNCQLMLITQSQATKSDPLLGDPTMAAIVPVGQFITSASFAIPLKAWRKLASGDVDDYIAHLVVVTRTDATSAIRLDDAVITGWTDVDNSLYSVVRVQVNRKPNGGIGVINSVSGETFSARLWGVADRESFAYTLGVNY